MCSNRILPWCSKARAATIRIDAYPDKLFNGKVTFIYPTVNPETRTAKVRIELPNAQGLLKPDMYGRVEFVSSPPAKIRSSPCPTRRCFDTGIRRLVLVDLGEGRFEPRTVKLGIHADGYAEVLGGLKAGERVVVNANFLIDAESNLKAALSGFRPTAVHGAHGCESSQARTNAPPPARSAPARPAGHHGEGIIEAIDFGACDGNACPWSDCQPQLAGDDHGFSGAGPGIAADTETRPEDRLRDNRGVSGRVRHRPHSSAPREQAEVPAMPAAGRGR